MDTTNDTTLSHFTNYVMPMQTKALHLTPLLALDHNEVWNAMVFSIVKLGASLRPSIYANMESKRKKTYIHVNILGHSSLVYQMIYLLKQIK